MTKEEYLEFKKGCLEEINQVNQNLELVCSLYVNSNQKYPIGTTLRITRSPYEPIDVIVINYKIENDDVVPVLIIDSEDMEYNPKYVELMEDDKIKIL